MCLSLAAKDLDHLNTRLEAEVDAKTRRLQILYNYMRDLNAASSRDNVLDRIMQCVTEITAARRISLFLLCPSGTSLCCSRAIGMDPTSVAPLDIEQIEGITGQVFATGKTLTANTFGDDANLNRDYASDAFLCTPIMTASRGSLKP